MVWYSDHSFYVFCNLQKYDKVQVVLASGMDNTDYALLLYETLGLPTTALPFVSIREYILT